MRDGAGRDVPLAMLTPSYPDYWRAADDLGFDQLALLLPTRPLDESLRLLDEYVALADDDCGQSRGGAWRSVANLPERVVDLLQAAANLGTGPLSSLNE